MWESRNEAKQERDDEKGSGCRLCKKVNNPSWNQKQDAPGGMSPEENEIDYLQFLDMFKINVQFCWSLWD